MSSYLLLTAQPDFSLWYCIDRKLHTRFNLADIQLSECRICCSGQQNSIKTDSCTHNMLENFDLNYHIQRWLLKTRCFDVRIFLFAALFIDFHLLHVVAGSIYVLYCSSQLIWSLGIFQIWAYRDQFIVYMYSTRIDSMGART